MVEVHLLRDIGKGPVVVVVVELERHARLGLGGHTRAGNIVATVVVLVGQRKPQVIRRNISDIAGGITGNENILPAVVVIIKGPSGKVVVAFNPERAVTSENLHWPEASGPSL